MTIQEIRPASRSRLLGKSDGATLDDPASTFEPYPGCEPDDETLLVMPGAVGLMRRAAAPVPVGARRGREALRWAAGQVDAPVFPPGKPSWKGYCLVFARSCFGVAARYGCAEEAYFAADFKHGTRETPPPGVPVWWTNGGYGHVAVSAGRGYCFSTDFRRSGLVDKVPITAITRGWGQQYRGWTEDINGVDVWSPRKRPEPKPQPGPRRAVSLANIKQSALSDALRPDGRGLHEHDVLVVEQALRKEGLLAAKYARDGYAGSAFRKAYAEWQRQVVGPPLDGIPGETSLRLLGKKHGFRVVD